MASIRKRSWNSAGNTKTAWVLDYKDQSGTRRLKTFKTRKAADEFLVEARHEVNQGTHTPDSVSVTVSEAAKRWLKGRELDGVERSTLRSYRSHVDLHIVPLIGSVKLSRLTKPQVEAFKDKLLEARSRAMAAKVLQSFRSMVADAQRRGLVSQNVAQGVTVKTRGRDKEPVKFPSREEINLMLRKVSGRRRPFIATAVFTGMRASELRGLTWEDVDFENKLIRVRQRADRWGVIGPPKSVSSRREIPVPSDLAATLKEWRLACPNGELDLVFPNGLGKVEDHSSIWRQCFAPLQTECGIVRGNGKPKYGLHALRHFYASWIIALGFSPKKAQALLGHSTIQMTFDVYGHLFPSLEDDHAKLDAGQGALIG